MNLVIGAKLFGQQPQSPHQPPPTNAFNILDMAIQGKMQPNNQGWGQQPGQSNSGWGQPQQNNGWGQQPQQNQFMGQQNCNWQTNNKGSGWGTGW